MWCIIAPKTAKKLSFHQMGSSILILCAPQYTIIPLPYPFKWSSSISTSVSFFSVYHGFLSNIWCIYTYSSQMTIPSQIWSFVHFWCITECKEERKWSIGKEAWLLYTEMSWPIRMREEMVDSFLPFTRSFTINLYTNLAYQSH